MITNLLPLSHLITERFLNIYESKTTTKIQIQTEGIRGTFKTDVSDLIVNVPKNRFRELANLSGLVDDTCIEKIWSDLKDPKHKRILELLITNSVRANHVFFDCAFIQSYDLHLRMFFRHSANTITQTPQKFSPLLHDSFHLLKEIMQGEYAIAQPTSEKPIIATWHLADCVAFVAFNALHKIGIVAHIDTYADVEDFFQQLKTNLRTISNENLTIDYVLIGGEKHSYLENHRLKIQKLAKKANDTFFTFKLESEIGEEIPHLALEKDSSWVISMRLHRSVSLDTRDEFPLKSLKSYDPDLYDESSLHKRSFTRSEALEFEKKREDEKKLTFV